MNDVYKSKCYAKLNLFLHIMGKTRNGYHMLDSMAMFAEDLYDEIIIEEGKSDHIKVEGKWKDKIDGANILEATLNNFRDIIGDKKFHVTIKKNIPVGAGLGGGSSDAAELIRYLIMRFKPRLNKSEIMHRCAAIGADVPLFYYGQALYFNGIGEIVSTIKTIPDLWAVIIYPDILVNTGEVFKMGFEFQRKEIFQKYSFETVCDLFMYLKNTDNDMFKNALTLVPSLKDILNVLKKINGCKLSRMSGSGSSCFGLFDSYQDAETALNTLQNKFSLYSIYLSKLK